MEGSFRSRAGYSVGDCSLHRSARTLWQSETIGGIMGCNLAHPISEHLGQTRFEEIKRYFHVSPPGQPKETSLGRRLWHSRVDVVLDQLRKGSQRYRDRSPHIAV